MRRVLYHSETMTNTTKQEQSNLQKLESISPPPEDADEVIQNQSDKKVEKQVNIDKDSALESVKNRIERVQLSQVRASLFGLMRFTFDLDNASFFRNRMVAALKTVSFAFTGAQGFNKTLLNAHLKYISRESIAYYVKYLREIIWPGGVILTSKLELSLIVEKEELKLKSAKLLHRAFPDQLSAMQPCQIVQFVPLYSKFLSSFIVSCK